LLKEKEKEKEKDGEKEKEKDGEKEKEKEKDGENDDGENDDSDSDSDGDEPDRIPFFKDKESQDVAMSTAQYLLDNISDFIHEETILSRVVDLMVKVVDSRALDRHVSRPDFQAAHPDPTYNQKVQEFKLNRPLWSQAKRAKNAGRRLQSIQKQLAIAEKTHIHEMELLNAKKLAAKKHAIDHENSPSKRLKAS
jgi:hypothetical protein